MTTMERLRQIAEASKVRDLTEEEKEEDIKGVRPIALNIAEAFEAMGKFAEGLADGLKVVQKHWKAFAARLSANAVLCQCPNKRVVHLAKHGRKWRTRKKNLHRAVRIVKRRKQNMGNKVKPTSLWDRIKNTIAALRGKPHHSMTLGIDVRRCCECGRVELRIGRNIASGRDGDLFK